MALLAASDGGAKSGRDSSRWRSQLRGKSAANNLSMRLNAAVSSARDRLERVSVVDEL